MIVQDGWVKPETLNDKINLWGTWLLEREKLDGYPFDIDKPDPDKWHTTSDVASMLGVTREQVANACRLGGMYFKRRCPDCKGWDVVSQPKGCRCLSCGRWVKGGKYYLNEEDVWQLPLHMLATGRMPRRY